MSDNQPQGAVDGNGQWQPGFHDPQGTWYGGFYDAHSQWQPGFYDQQGTWHAGFHDQQGTWHPGFRAPDGTWTDISRAAQTSPQQEDPEEQADDAAPAEQQATHAADAPEQAEPADEQPTEVLPAESPSEAGGDVPGDSSEQLQATTALPPLSASTPADPAAAAHEQAPAQHQEQQPYQQPAAHQNEPEKKGSGSRGMCLVLAILSLVTAAILAAAAWLLLINEDTRQWDLFGDDGENAEERDEERLDEDGDEEQEADDEASVVEPGFFLQEPDEAGFERGEDFAELPTLSSPVGSVAFDEFAEVESVEVDGEPAVAPEGEELRYVAWSYVPAEEEWPEDGELTVRIGGEDQSGPLSDEDVSGSFIASVADEDALVLTAHGVEQEVSLSQGDLDDADAALFRLPEVPHTDEIGATFSFPEQSLSDGDDSAEHETELTISRAMLTYEHEELEWDLDEYNDGYNEGTSDNWMLYGLESTGPAEAGSIWLILDMRIEMQGPDGTLDFDGGTWTITATDEDGQSTQHEYTSQASGINQWPYGDYGAALQIPISASTVELTAELDIDYGGGSDTIETDEPVILEFPVED
ncbi:hypothetical protein [Nesterenkonia populi]